MIKKYVGRSADLTMARLEATAHALEALSNETGKTRLASGESQQVKDTVSQHQVPLLASKLHLPRLHASLISRERLLARLEAGLERKLTLLSAPAGFGKTTLVRQWVADRSARHSLPPVAWVSLDPGDNDPVRFWRYVITACQAFQADLGQPTLAMLSTTVQPPFEPSPLETVLTTFLNALTQYSHGNLLAAEAGLTRSLNAEAPLPDWAIRGILILEDYHVITSSQIHKTVTFLLDHLPATMHLVILTRSEPPLPLARLRARGDLCELHASDLRFSPEETANFLQQTIAFPLSSEAISKLETHLEGWAAGLRLVALALGGRMNQQEIEHALATFTGNHRPLQEYFITEVLSAQPDTLQNFLLYTSVLSSLTSSLCDAVTGRNDSERLLESLDRANLFLEPIDGSGQWYRYHALFGESIQQEALRRLGADTLRALSYKASQWYEQHGFLSEAVEAAFRAQDVARAAGLIERFIGTQHFRKVNEFHTLRRWLEQIPETTMRSRPALCLSYATALLFVSISDRPVPETMTRIERALQMAEQGWQSSGNTSRLGEVFAFRSLIAHQQGENNLSVTYARQALTWLPADELPWRSVSLIVVGAEELQSGHLDVARQLLLEARACCEATSNRYFTRATINMLGEVCFEQGELHRAAEYYRLVLTEAREREDLDDISHALLGLAQLSYEWNDLQEAWRAAQEVLDLGQQLSHESHQAHAAIMLARVQHARGQAASAQQQLAALLARMQPSRSPLLYQEVLAWQTRLQLAVGNLSAVQRWVTSRSRNETMLPLVYHEREELIVARWLLAQGEAEESLAILDRLLPAAREAGRIRSSQEIQVLMALAHVALKQVPEARQRLRVVLSFAHGEGYLRLLLDEGETIATLLRTIISHLQEKPLITYLQTILHAFAQEQAGQDTPTSPVPPGASQLIDPLSPQEQRVLRLLAAGRSNPEIARELIVSVNTIRTQVQSIYRKLNVNNRVAASAVAHHLQLL